ncbi:MAG: MarR family transcriptional regulator [Butyrivibrio sp.]|nr:MarR family transcriptional regulator [Butyrivibrio sp.]
MENTDDLALLIHFYQCAHKIHHAQKYPGQGRILTLLLENGMMTQRELITITGRRSATLSEQLENMEHTGYITRKRNEQDKRNVDVTLTKSGIAAAEDAVKFREALSHDLFDEFSEEDKKQFDLLLERMLHKLRCRETESEDMQQ